MPFDLDTLLGSDPSGLLTPQERGGVTGQGLMGMGAALLKAAAPSPYKHTTLSGLGEGIQGLVSSQNTARDQMLKQQLVRANVFDKFLPVFKAAQQYDALSQPRPPELQRMLSVFGNMVAGSPFGRGPSGVAQPGAVAQGGVSPPPGAAVAPGATAAPTGNLVVDTARGMGYNPGMLAEGMPGRGVVEKGVEEHIRATDPALEEQKRREAVLAATKARHEKLYPAMVALGGIGKDASDMADVSVALMDQPSFYSGAGASVVEGLKKLGVALGTLPPTAAAAMEGFRKVTAANINTMTSELRTLASEAGPGAGRIFDRQAANMERASQGLPNTPEANRFLADMQKRASVINRELSRRAIDYAEKHGFLDAGFDRKVTEYLDSHPLYNPEELKALHHVAPAQQPAPAMPGAGAAPVPGAIGPLGGQGGSAAPKPGTYNWTPNGMVPVQ